MYSPPWENELSRQEISAVALFVGHLYEQPESAAQLLDGVAGKSANDVARGKFLFMSRCVVCHGEGGMAMASWLVRLLKIPFLMT